MLPFGTKSCQQLPQATTGDLWSQRLPMEDLRAQAKQETAVSNSKRQEHSGEVIYLVLRGREELKK